MKFRSDINALRAIAIIGVLIFHFSHEWMPGGFAGVDVFFVISGFLMTAIVFDKLLPGRINLWEFYLARANRIIPALLVLCLVLLILGWFFVTPIDYRALAKHAAASSTFISNIIYYREIDYFDASSSEKWLLHTWSLSVEWQFYIIYPACLLILSRFFKRRNLTAFLWMAFFVSLLAAIWAADNKQQLGFYMLPFRAWEMLLGGLVYLYPVNIKQKYKFAGLFVGLLGIAYSYLFYSESLAWPGIYAVLPAISAAIVIVVNYNALWFNSLPIKKIGSWSYSIYLWHWPIVVLGVYFWLPEFWPLFGIPISIFLGYLSYQFVERVNFSRSCDQFIRLIFKPSVFSILPVFILSLVLYLNDGFVNHYDNQVVFSNQEKNNFNPLQCMQQQDATAKFLHCVAGVKSDDQPKFIVVGDSHANAVSSAVFQSLHGPGYGLNYVRAGCPYIIGQKNRNTNNNVECIDDNKNRTKYLLDDYKNTPVIWSARLAAYLFGQSNPRRVERGDKFPSIYFDNEYEIYSYELLRELEKHLLETVCELTKDGRKVGIVGSIPEMSVNVPDFVSRKALLGKKVEVKITLSQHLSRTKVIDDMLQQVALSCDAEFLDPKEYLCDERFCYGTVDGFPLYYDGDHLSEFGNKRLVSMFDRFMN